MQTIFISMIGLEERVLGVFREGKTIADEYLLFINEESKQDPRVVSYQNEIVNKHLVGEKFSFLYSSYYDPFAIIKEFNKYRSEKASDFQRDKINVVLDISTFNRQNLLVMLFLLRKVLKVPDLEIVYTVPIEVNERISRGARGFTNVPFFGGVYSIEKKRLLILLIGYEVDRPLLLWRELEPSKVILVEGVEPTDISFYGKNKEAVDKISNYSVADIKQVSARDPNKAKIQLADIFQKEKTEFNIFVSPLNTKLQAVGLYLAWEDNPEVQIVIASPDTFSSWLTRGIREVKRYRI